MTHLNSANLHKRLSELEQAVKAEVKSASAEDLALYGRVSLLKQNLEMLRNIKLGDLLTEDKLKEMRQLLDLIPNGNRLISETPADLYAETAIRLIPCSTDDIDHLENKRIRSVGELLQDQLRMGFLRMEKVAKERMTSLDPENVIPQVILSVKPISASIKSFFGSSQLSQFMDQTNPLAELTHKRRLSALGPGGLSQAERQAGSPRRSPLPLRQDLSDRDARRPEHRSDRFDGDSRQDRPIRIPQEPYRVVKSGKVSDEMVYMSADEESQEYIAPANTLVDPGDPRDQPADGGRATREHISAGGFQQGHLYGRLADADHVGRHGHDPVP